MLAIYYCLDPSCLCHFTYCFHRRDLACDVDLMRNENQAGATSDSFFKCGCNLIQILRRDGNLDQLEYEAFTLFALAQSCQHARVVLSGSKNLVAGFEVYAHEQNFE